MASSTIEALFKTGKHTATYVVSFRLESHMGRPAEAWVDVQFADPPEPDELLGESAVLAFAHEGEATRAFHGLVEAVTVAGGPEVEGTFGYRLHVVSKLALLARSEDCRIFQDLDVKGIVSKVLEDHGLAADEQEWKLTASHPKRPYCVQYDESALAFVTRLCEAEGIWFHYQPAEGEGRAKIHFGDDSTAVAPVEGKSVRFAPHAGTDEREDVLSEITARRRVVSGKFVLRDFDFERPKVDLTARAEADAHADLEVYDFPGGYFDKSVGDRLAKVRLQAEQVGRSTLDVEGECLRLVTGRKVEIEDGDEVGADGEYVVLNVVQEMRHPEGATIGEGGQILRTYATLLTAAVPYRLPLVTPRPIIHGPQSAAVVAPAGSQQEEIHTDEHGRAKVKFHWDRSPVLDDRASCWMRVTQLQTSGSMVLPRIGWEVVVEYLEGDPDRPVVTGRVYDGLYMPPYELPSGRTRSSLQSASTPGGGGRNEIRMEDKAGGEEIMVHSQHDTKIKVANNKTKNVLNDETSTVKVDHTMKVGAKQEIKISMGHKHDVTSDQTIVVGASRKVEINAVAGIKAGGGISTTVGASQFEMVGNPLEGLIAVAVAKAAEVLQEKAEHALHHVTGQVMGKVNQVMGPVNALVGKAQAIGGGMAALASGNVGAAAGLIAAGGSLGGALGGGGLPGLGGLAATTKAGPGGKGSSAGGISVEQMVGNYVSHGIAKGVHKAALKLEGGSGEDASGGGGESEKNAAGPEGEVGGISEEDKEKGPGHNHMKVGASMTEKVGAVKIVAALEGVRTNAVASMTQTIGAARVGIAVKDWAESVEGLKTEKALGLVVITKGDETETVGAAKSQMVGGAIVEKIAGNHTIVAGAPLTLVGALHKWTASGKITLKCGGSSVVIDGAGVTIQSTLINVLAPKIKLPKAATEV